MRAQPNTSTVVLARTKAEGRALSWLMRQRVLAQTPDAKRTVIEVSRDLDGRVTEPLEIAVGDRIRIGATQWEKQLFNGTVVTVEDLEVRRADAAAVSRKARNAVAAGWRTEAHTDRPEPEFSVHITARTDDGRRVTFRHDEIRDWHDNIRIDYGYAMTIASAQGLTVDRAFLLADDRPARETIYPAATRHREGLDIYVNRSPLVFDIAERRPEDQADMPVTDADMRAYLAERWSRSQPKEAALDYVSDGAWRDAKESARAGIGNGHGRPRSAEHRGPGDGQGEATEARAAANDNAIVRIAQEIRHAVNGWRHGAAVDAFAAERAEVLAAWDELRERARSDGDAVALSPAFRDTLDRHGALMKQARMFRAGPQVFERLLVERAGISEGELEQLREQHNRAGKYLRSVKARTAHSTRQNAPHEEPGIVEAIAVGSAAPAAQPAPQEHAQGQPIEPTALSHRRDSKPTWETLYDRLEGEWNDLVAVANRAGLPLPLVHGYDELIGHARNLAEHPQLPSNEQQELTRLFDYHRTEMAARGAVHDYLAAAERHVKACEPLQRDADSLNVHIADVDGWPDWQQEARRLEKAGKAILADEDTYGAYLDAVAAGQSRARLTVEQLHSRMEEGCVKTAKSEQSEPRRSPAPKQQEGIAYILENPAILRELREQLKKRERKIGRHRRSSRGRSM